MSFIKYYQLLTNTMLKISKDKYTNTYEITKGDCHPPNRIGNFDKKDLGVLYRKIGKIISVRDYRKEVSLKVVD